MLLCEQFRASHRPGIIPAGGYNAIFFHNRLSRHGYLFFLWSAFHLRHARNQRALLVCGAPATGHHRTAPELPVPQVSRGTAFGPAGWRFSGRPAT
jgi:hypothetical protein